MGDIKEDDATASQKSSTVNKEHTENLTISSDLNHQETRKSLWRLFRTWPRLTLWAIALCTPILLYGYDFVIVGNITSVPAFQREYGKWLDDRFIIPSAWLSIWSVASPIGQMLGAVVGGAFQNRFGRRWSLAVSSFFSAIGVAVCYVSDLPGGLNGRRGTFTAGKALQGASIGMMLCTTQTYMSEVLPPVLRGPVLAFFPIFTLVGQLLGAVAVYTSLGYPGSISFRVPFASQWPFSAITLTLSWFLPESPAWILREGGHENTATRSQQRLTDGAEKVIEDLQATIREEREHSEAVSYAECFRGTNRRRTLIVIFANFLPQIFGLKLLSLVSYFIQIVGMPANLSIIMLIVGLVAGIFANVASMWTLKAFGRRQLIIVTLSISTLLWASMGIAGCFEGVVMVWYTAISLMCVTLVCGMGVWPVSYVLAAETSSLRIRALTQGIGWFSAGLSTAILGIILPYIFNPDAGNLKAKTGFVYAGFCIIGVVITWWSVPEMKNRTTADIDAMFAAKLPARKFSKW